MGDRRKFPLEEFNEALATLSKDISEASESLPEADSLQGSLKKAEAAIKKVKDKQEGVVDGQRF